MRVVFKPYPEEFRRDVVAVARKREVSLAQIAKDFGIHESTLADWLKKTNRSNTSDAFGHNVDSEVATLRKRNRLLEQENEVLRRAAAYLSQANLPKK
jgi:transposase